MTLAELMADDDLDRLPHIKQPPSGLFYCKQCRRFMTWGVGEGQQWVCCGRLLDPVGKMREGDRDYDS